MKRTSIFLILISVLSLSCMLSSADTLAKWEDSKYTTWSETEEITGKSAEIISRAGEASMELDITMPDTIEVGESLTVIINNADDFTWSQPVFVRNQGGTIGYLDVRGGTVVLPDYFFDVGEFTIDITGYDKVTSERIRVSKPLTVTGIPGKDGPTITSDQPTANIQDNITFTVAMPGAERFAVRFINKYSNGSSYSRYNTFDIADQITQTYSSTYGNSIVTCFAKAYINGAWTAETKCEVLINEAPKLSTPVVTVPADVEIGHPFKITVEAVENAEYYHVIFYRNSSWVSDETYPEAGTYTLPALDEPGVYRVSIYASAEGYEQSDNFWSDINAVGELVEGPTLTSNKEEFEVNDEAVFTAFLENAEQFKFMLYAYRPDGTYTRWSEQIMDAVEGEAEYDNIVGSDYESGRLEMHVRALINGVWTAETVLSVPVKSANRLPTPTLTIPESPHEAGVPVSIQIGEVEGAAWYNVDVYLYNDYWYYLYNRFYDGAGENILDGLAEPGTYKIALSAYPINNDEFIVSKKAEATLVIAGSLEDGPSVATDKLTVPIDSSLMIIASLKGAEKFFINSDILDKNGNRSWLSFYCDSVDACDGYGTFNIDFYNNTELINKSFVAKVSALINGKWTAASEIRIPIISQEQPVILSPDFILPDDLKTIEASAFENIAATSVYFPDACTSIGPLAFASSQIQQIRLPQNCAVSDTAFENCSELTVIVALPGGTSETWARTYCNNHPNCKYVEGDLFQ